jgi:hypothetical protein
MVYISSKLNTVRNHRTCSKMLLDKFILMKRHCGRKQGMAEKNPVTACHHRSPDCEHHISHWHEYSIIFTNHERNLHSALSSPDYLKVNNYSVITIITRVYQINNNKQDGETRRLPSSIKWKWTSNMGYRRRCVRSAPVTVIKKCSRSPLVTFLLTCHTCLLPRIAIPSTIIYCIIYCTPFLFEPL